MKDVFSRSEPARQRHTNQSGFTLIEMLIVISIIALLAAILFPVFARARENARRASCQSNLKQIGLSIMMYTQDYDETFPPIAFHDIALGYKGDTWMDEIRPYVKSKQLFDCPSKAIKGLFNEGKFTWDVTSYDSATSYGMSWNQERGKNKSVMGWLAIWNDPDRARDNNPVKLATVTRPSEIIYIGESDGSVKGQFRAIFAGGGFRKAFRHLETTNILFVDGHVKALKSADIEYSSHKCMYEIYPPC